MDTIKLIEIIHSTSAISPRTGLKAYTCISDLLEKKKKITLSFAGISDCTSAFCNSFIGKLYMNFDPKVVDTFLHIEGLESHPIWQNKVHNARLLGTNENVRTVRQSNINDLIIS